eukprot:scaffold7791_cov133-Isochrysis_galbana.AAC.5
MAPRQLIMPPMEDDTNPEPGSKRVRTSSADKSSTQTLEMSCCVPFISHLLVMYLPRMTLRALVTNRLDAPRVYSHCDGYSTCGVCSSGGGVDQCPTVSLGLRADSTMFSIFVEVDPCFKAKGLLHYAAPSPSPLHPPVSQAPAPH